MKLLALADVISPGMILVTIHNNCFFFHFQFVNFVCIGLSQLRGTLLINLASVQLKRLRKDFEGVKKIPDGTDSKLEVCYYKKISIGNSKTYC